MSQQAQNVTKQTLVLSLELVNGLANYLGTRPHNDVDNLIMRLRQEVGPQLQPKPELVVPNAKKEEATA